MSTGNMKGARKEPTVRVQKIKKNHAKTRLLIFLLMAAALLLVVIFAEQLCPYDPNAQNTSMALQPPGAAHPAGTDRFGRDMLSRILVGLQTSIASTLTLVVIITLAGTVVGVICGYYGGVIDSVVMRISDVCMAFPGLVFAMAIAALLNGGLTSAVFALAVISWPKYARIARSQTLAQKNSNYVSAARLAGALADRAHLAPALVEQGVDEVGLLELSLVEDDRPRAIGPASRHAAAPPLPARARRGLGASHRRCSPGA